MQNIELFKEKTLKTFKLTSDISKSCRKYYSQNNKENGNTSPWTFSGKIFLRKMPWMAMSRRFWRSITLQIISHGQKWGIWRGVLKGAPGKKILRISVKNTKFSIGCDRCIYFMYATGIQVWIHFLALSLHNTMESVPKKKHY